MSYTGSISTNLVKVGIPPPIRQELHSAAKHLGMRVPEVIRAVLLRWYEDRQLWQKADK